MTGWRTAMTTALYGPDGFFRVGAGPADHFRTSVHASPLFAAAILRLVERIDAALDHPARLDVVDVGAGRGELLTALLTAARSANGGPTQTSPTQTSPTQTGRAQTDPAPEPVRPLAERLRLMGVEIAARPAGLSDAIGWSDVMPDKVFGLLVATEWLDNVPVDAAEVDADGTVRRVLVDAAGTESAGDPVNPADRFWLARWWPLDGEPAGTRAEIGWPRDLAWADAVGTLVSGCALAVDYGHLRADRPPFGSLTGYRDGRQVAPVPDGHGDLTAHVAMDAVATAAGTPYTLRRQREALRALGVDGARPPLALASTDPARYVRDLAAASSAAELTEPSGLGAHWWLLHTVGLDPVSPQHLLSAQSSAGISSEWS